STRLCRYKFSSCCAGCSVSSRWRCCSSPTTLASRSRFPIVSPSCTPVASSRPVRCARSSARRSTLTPRACSPRPCTVPCAAGGSRRSRARRPISPRFLRVAPLRPAAATSSLPAPPPCRAKCGSTTPAWSAASGRRSVERVLEMLRLAVADLDSPSYFVATAAAELGYFQQEGVDVELEHGFGAKDGPERL